MTEQELQWQDEILQLLYWMRGENLAADASLDEMNRFLQLPESDLHAAVVRLADANLVEMSAPARFQLTQQGIEQGKRRFADEFSGYLGKETHIECSDPDCDCHSPEFSGVCKHAV